MWEIKENETSSRITLRETIHMVASFSKCEGKKVFGGKRMNPVLDSLLPTI